MAPTVFMEDMASSPSSDTSDHDGEIDVHFRPVNFINNEASIQERQLHQRMKTHKVLESQNHSYQGSQFEIELLSERCLPESDSSTTGNLNKNNIRRDMFLRSSLNEICHVGCISRLDSDGEDAATKENTERQRYRKYSMLGKRENLLDITIRTVALARRNQLLQNRLIALQEETKAFIKSVLNNPENNGLDISTDKVLKRKQDSGFESENEVVMKDVSFVPQNNNCVIQK